MFNPKLTSNHQVLISRSDRPTHAVTRVGFWKSSICHILIIPSFIACFHGKWNPSSKSANSKVLCWRWTESKDKFTHVVYNVLKYDEQEMAAAHFPSDCVLWFKVFPFIRPENTTHSLIIKNTVTYSKRKNTCTLCVLRNIILSFEFSFWFLFHFRRFDLLFHPTRKGKIHFSLASWGTRSASVGVKLIILFKDISGRFGHAINQNNSGIACVFFCEGMQISQFKKLIQDLYM